MEEGERRVGVGVTRHGKVCPRKIASLQERAWTAGQGVGHLRRLEKARKGSSPQPPEGTRPAHTLTSAQRDAVQVSDLETCKFRPRVRQRVTAATGSPHGCGRVSSAGVKALRCCKGNDYRLSLEQHSWSYQSRGRGVWARLSGVPAQGLTACGQGEPGLRSQLEAQPRGSHFSSSLDVAVGSGHLTDSLGFSPGAAGGCPQALEKPTALGHVACCLTGLLTSSGQQSVSPATVLRHLAKVMTPCRCHCRTLLAGIKPQTPRTQGRHNTQGASCRGAARRLLLLGPCVPAPHWVQSPL